MSTKAQRLKAIDRLAARRQIRLIELFGPELALEVDCHLDKALAHIAYAAIQIVNADKDERDLLILFTEHLNDTYNMMARDT